MFKRVPTSELEAGVVLGSPIFGADTKMLLAAGLPLTEALLERLRERGVTTVVIDVDEMPTAVLDREIEGGGSFEVAPQGTAILDTMKRHGVQAYNEEQLTCFRQENERYVEELEPWFTALAGEYEVKFDTLASISNRALLQIAEDMDLFVCLGIEPSPSDYPFRHSLKATMLAMAIGVNMGWDQPTVSALAIGSLIHDVGMLKVDKETYSLERKLNECEFEEIINHPIEAVNLLQHIWDDIPSGARFVAYQMHERCNGSGYPHGQPAERIHELAKVAAIADVFTALVATRPHRDGLQPYEALKVMLNDVKQGLYDSTAFRALLDTISLFPIGSFVALNDGRTARVIRANRGRYDSPIVEAWESPAPGASSEVINLARTPKVKIQRTLHDVPALASQ